MHSPRSSAPRALWSTIALLGGALLGTSAGAATFSVTNTNDAGAGSLRQAIADANASVDLSDTITFDPATFGTTPQTILLNGSELAIAKNLTITGPGANLLTIDTTNVQTLAVRALAASPAGPRIFHITGGSVQISGLTATDGFSNDNGGCIVVESGATLTLLQDVISNSFATISGGGLYIDTGGTATLTDCTVSGNQANGGTGSSAAGGGGIMNLGTLTMTGTTVSGNNANGTGAAGLGGGLATMAPSASSASTLTNCTFVNNSAARGGGLLNMGVVFAAGGPPVLPTTASTTLTDCTVTGNTATTSGGGLDTQLSGFSAQASLVAGNFCPAGTGPDAFSANNPFFSGTFPFTSNGSNLIGIGDGSTGFANGTNHDQVGTVASPIDPGLDPTGAQNNGGPTLTVALLPGSPAIDADFSATPPATDQRGQPRPQGVRADIGAFELRQDNTPPVTTVALTGPSFANGFWRGPVTVTLTATDSGSGVASTFYRVDSGPQQTYSGPFTVSGDFQHLVTFYSTDNAGNAEAPNGGAAFKIDSTPPITLMTSRAVATGREVTLKNTDNFSGPGGTFYRVDSGPQQTYSGPFIVTGNFQHLVTAYSIDRALNAEGPNKSLTFTLTAPPPAPAAPTTTAALSASSFVNGFYRGPVTVTLTATGQNGPAATFYRVDSGAQQTYTGPFTVSGDFAHLVTFYSVANGGLTESPARSTSFSIDSTPPVTTITSRIVGSGREVTLKNTDNFSGPGGTFYRVDSGPQRTYAGPFTVTGGGQHLVTAYSVDRALNAESPAKSLTFSTAPTTTASLSGPSFVNGYWRGPVTVTFTVSAGEAGGTVTTFYRVDSGPQQTYTGPFTVSGDFAHLVTFYSADSAGGTESPNGAVTFKIDGTPPVTTITSGNASGGQEVTIAATDNFSGLAGTFYRVDGRSPQAYSGPFLVTGRGQHTVSAFSVDRAGNTEAPARTLRVTNLR